MKNIYTPFKLLIFTLIISLSNQVLKAQFTAGRLVVLQVGDGSAALTNAATPVFLKEFTTTGTAGITGTIPTTGSTRLTISGTSTSDGQITLSADGQYITIGGYDAASGTAAVTGTTSATVNRVINTADVSVNVIRAGSTTTQYSANNFRSAVRSSVNNYWGAGGNSGTYYFGTTAAAATVQNTIANTRVLNILNGNLYFSTGSGTVGIYGFTGLPTSTATASLIIGTSGSPYAFAINSAGTIAYIADDRTTGPGGVQKWTFNGTVWSLAYTFIPATNIGARGLAVDFSGANPILYATTTGNQLVSFTDAGAASAPTVLATAPTNTAYRGVVFAPVAAPVIPSVNLSVTSNSSSETSPTAITVTATASSAVTGNQTVDLTVTGTNITTGDYTLNGNNVNTVSITIPNGGTTGTATFLVVDDAVVEATETAILTISNPSTGITLGSPITQNISITDNDNTPPTIVIDVATTTNYIDGGAVSSPASPFAVSGVISDPSSPEQTLGIDFTVADNETPAASLIVTASSSNISVVPNANIIISGAGASKKVKITPAAIGYSTITLTVDDGITQTSFVINYAASAASVVPASTRFHTGTSDASTAIVIDNNYMLVGDDENQALRLYNRQNSGLPVNSFDYTSSLNLTDLSGGLPREVDIEASVKVGNRIYWLGSHSNAASGNSRPNRNRLFATDISGTGAATTLAYVGRYDGLKTDLLNWDATNAHGLGANYFGLTASATVGVIPEVADGSGFNIEGLVMAPDGTTGYICFRAPIEPTTNRTKALIVPVTNFTSLVTANPTPGPATFGSPIQLDLGGRGIREIRANASGQYVIIAGPHDGATGVQPKDFRLYTWTGNATDLPVLRTANLTALNANGSFESIVDLPDPLTNASQLQVLVDNGDAVYYNDAVIAKDLTQNNFKKFRSDTIVLGTPLQINTGLIAGTPLCLSANLGVPYSLTGTADPGNTFTAQLSNAAGSFISPVNIGSVTSTSNTGFINTQIPATTTAASLYRIRVVASNPLITGDDNGVNITISNTIPALASSNQNITQDVADNSFEAGACTDLIANVFPNGLSPVTGNVNSRVWIESSVPAEAGIPYVQRHYEITPATGAATATGRITLYFTQTEFNNFNNDPASALDLPTGAGDIAGISNLRVGKYAGVSNNGSGLPSSYSGSAVVINPVDAGIIWNSAASRWEVSFDVTGFSGFIIQTSTSVLPVSLLSFTAQPVGKDALIQWKSANEINHSYYEVQYSTDGRNFNLAGQRNAQSGAGEKNYSLTHINAAAIANKLYYRLKMVAANSTVTYSNIVLIRFNGKGQLITDLYPNPTNGIVNIVVSGLTNRSISLQIADMSGRILAIKQLTVNGSSTLDLNKYAPGVYLLEAKLPDGHKQQFKLLKQ